jgi:hypothetical protein
VLVAEATPVPPKVIALTRTVYAVPLVRLASRAAVARVPVFAIDVVHGAAPVADVSTR